MQSFNYTVAALLAVFVAVTCIDAAVLWRTRDRHLGIQEDHFDKGVSLYETGTMALGSKPMVFRPPGYPAFVAATLAIKDAALTLAQSLPGNTRPAGGARVSVLAAHAVLLGVLGAAILWFALGRAGPFVAATSAIAVACNPLLVIIAGHVSYPLLHLVILTIATLLLLRCAEDVEPRNAVMFGNGLVWGAATLVKSVTLIAPAFVLLWAWRHVGVRNAARTTAFFTAGLLLVVAPYTARNYVVTGRLIPVNAQASFAFWATTLERIPSGANYHHWVNVWFASGMKIYTDVTGRSDYSPAVFEDHVLELGDRFRVSAAEHFRRDPMVYASNALHNSLMFIMDWPTAYWFDSYAFAWPSDARVARVIAGLSIGLMTVVSMFAIVIGSLRGDPRWTLLLALFALMWASHALTFLEARYLYIKVPTIVTGFVLACVLVSSGRRPGWSRGAAGLAAFAAVLSLVGLFAL
jgi:hypothetical protein